ncbi:MAG: sulfatase [Phycisphaerales bacterium]|nr:sulfatase [Phycisphaerales bacterium]
MSALRRRRPFSYLMLLAVGIVLPGAGPAPGHERSPNVVLIVADDLGWADITPNNPSTFYRTPNLERLAASGVRFTQAYAASPVCSPTRGSIMTGRHPARTRTTDWFGGARKARLLPADYRRELPLEERTIAECLGDAGYDTFFAGKWHLGPEGRWPEDQGFDINRGGWTRGGPYGGGKYFSPYGNPRLEDGPPGEHLPDRLARETVEFMEGRQETPFLAVLSFYSVHTPLLAPEGLVATHRARRESLEVDGPRWGRERARKVRLVQDHAVYAAMVETMDRAVGTVLDGLDRLGLAEDTVVIFFSDNGGLSTSEGHPTSNLPFRAGKGWLYEGGIREPCIVAAPGGAVEAVCDTPVTSADLLPTILDLCGVEPDADRPIDGRSLRPMLEDPRGKDVPRDLFWHYPHYGNQGGAPSGAIRSGDLKLIEWFEDGRIELFDLASDPGERVDLAPQRPDEVRRLSAALAGWRLGVDAAMPRPNPEFEPPKPEDD